MDVDHLSSIIENNTIVEFSKTRYHYWWYVDNNDTKEDPYWAPVYPRNCAEFDNDQSAVDYLNSLKEKYPKIKFKLIIHKRLDTRKIIE